jgi:hypothetical protein
LGKTVEKFYIEKILKKENFLLLRLQIGFGSFKEYILCVKSMLNNPDELVVRAATIIKSL